MSLGDVLSSGVVLQSIGIVAAVVAANGAPTEPTPDAAAAAKSNEEEVRQKLRKQHGVRLVTKDEEGDAVERMPAGTYGWTNSPATESPLFAKRNYQSFEKHKAADGIYLVGYVTAANAQSIRKGTVETEANLYPEPFGDAVELVSIPLGRAQARSKQPSRINGNWFKILVHPA